MSSKRLSFESANITEINPSLIRSLLNPRFVSPQLESQWQTERSTSFKRVNTIAMITTLVINLIFIVIEILLLDSTEESINSRLISCFIVFITYIISDNISKVIWGDRLLFIFSSVFISHLWFQIFLNLPESIITQFWLVMIAIIIIIIQILIELHFTYRVLLTGVIIFLGIITTYQLCQSLIDQFLSIFHITLIAIIGLMGSRQIELSKRVTFAKSQVIIHAQQRTESLLKNILPDSIAERLMKKPETIAERYQHVTVLFADIVGFTPWAASSEAIDVVEVLDDIFSAFDLLCDKYKLEKIKTIGDAYMVAGGVPLGDGGKAKNMVYLALDMIEVMKQIPTKNQIKLQIRIGIHEGPVVAGVIGQRKFLYDLWGDTVNIASRMESHGVSGSVQATQVIVDQLGELFSIESRGKIQIKGKGHMKAFIIKHSDHV
jgi:class 3 adenylate cyclase